jgi:hypothetical protein
MVKDNETVIEEFNGLVNMTAKELEDWLKTDESTGSGWSKDDGSGETIGHDRYVLELHACPSSWIDTESGRKIIEILKKNPKKDPEQYVEGMFPRFKKC